MQYVRWRLERIGKGFGKLILLPVLIATAPFALLNDMARRLIFLCERR